MNLAFIIWSIICGICIIFELTSPGFFFFLSFAFGSVAAAITSLLQLELSTQLIAFLLATFFSFLLLKYWVKTSSGPLLYKTNVEALVGKKAIVLQDITSAKKGLVKIDGETWSARSVDNSWIQIGSMVEVVATHGSHVIVKKTENNN